MIEEGRNYAMAAMTIPESVKDISLRKWSLHHFGLTITPMQIR